MILRRLRAAVVGCSGTGSPTVEQLYRLGVGELVLVDPDVVGVENLNRILNTGMLDAQQRRPKVQALEGAIHNAGLGTDVVALARDLFEPEVVREVALCDVIFGCVDSVFARRVLNKLASTYCITYFDLGVGLQADGKGGISHISGAVHYLQPDGSSLLSRGAYTLDAVEADALRRTDPAEHSKRLAAGYIAGATVARPAVISVNMIFSGLGVLEFLHRLHPMRDEPNGQFALQRISRSSGLQDIRDDGERCLVVSRTPHGRSKRMSMWRKFVAWIWSWFSERTWQAVRAEDVPVRLRNYRVYLIGEDDQVWQVAMLCPCGCGAVIQLCVLQESRPHWAVTGHADGNVSLHPSVWRTTGCRSHFFLRAGRIDWC